MSSAFVILQISITLISLMLVIAALAARQVAEVLADRLLAAVSRHRWIVVPVGSGALIVTWMLAVSRDGGSPSAGLVVGVVTSAAHWRLSWRLHARWLERQRHVAADRPALPPRRPTTSTWPAPAVFVPAFTSLARSESRASARVESGSRHLRRVRRDLLLIAGVSYLVSILCVVLDAFAAQRVALTVASTALVAVLVLAAVRAGYGKWRQRSTRDARVPDSVEAVAAAHGWDVFLPGHPGVGDRWPATELLPEGSPRVLVPTTLVARVGSWVLLALDEVSPTTHASGRPTQKYAYVLWLPGLALPAVVVSGREDRPPGVRSQDFELEEFNRRFVVQSGDEQFASMLLHPRMMEQILRTLPDGSQMTAAHDGLVLTGGGPLVPATIEEHIGCLVGLANLIPQYVVKDFSLGDYPPVSRRATPTSGTPPPPVVSG